MRIAFKSRGSHFDAKHSPDSKNAGRWSAIFDFRGEARRKVSSVDRGNAGGSVCSILQVSRITNPREARCHAESDRQGQ
jgi:hypothetical protein